VYMRVCKHADVHVVRAYSYMYVCRCACVSVVVCVFRGACVCFREQWCVRVYLQADGPFHASVT